MLSILSVQLGSAVAKGLFALLGPVATVFVRVAVATLLLVALWRPSLRGHTRHAYWIVILFGLSIAGLNTFFYLALARIPLGIAVSVEIIGPLGVAIVASRSLRDLVWAALAVAGIALLTPFGTFNIDPLGLGLALLGGACWAAYIVLNIRVGRSFRGGTGLALGMGVAAIIMAPLGIASGGMRLLAPAVLLRGALVAVLSTFIPFSLELEALRRLPAHAFGVLLSVEPAVAALIGFVVLGEAIQLRGLVAIVLITVASAGSALLG
jgi:inner membrane transporter RhtA